VAAAVAGPTTGPAVAAVVAVAVGPTTGPVVMAAVVAAAVAGPTTEPVVVAVAVGPTTGPAVAAVVAVAVGPTTLVRPSERDLADPPLDRPTASFRDHGEVLIQPWPILDLPALGEHPQVHSEDGRRLGRGHIQDRHVIPNTLRTGRLEHGAELWTGQQPTARSFDDLDRRSKVLIESRLVGPEILDLVEQHHTAGSQLRGPACDDLRAIWQVRQQQPSEDDVGGSDRERGDEHIVFHESHPRRRTSARAIQERTRSIQPYRAFRLQRIGDQTSRVARSAAEVEGQAGHAWRGTFEEAARGRLEDPRHQIEPIAG
jgi:hypothetical protein